MPNGTHELECRLNNRFNGALRSSLEHWQETHGKDFGTYGKCLTAFTNFCNEVTRRQNDAYRIGSKIICSGLYQDVVPRELRSVILTALTRWPYESLARNEPVRGRIVSHFGRVLNRTADQYADMFVDWFEDMGHGIALTHETDGVPEGGFCDWLLAPQTTRMLRGVLFAARLRDGVMDEFWRLAARSDWFPTRIFTDPGDFEGQSCLFSPTQLGQLAAFCNHAPEEAVRCFAAVYAEHVKAMRLIVYAQVILPGGDVVQVALCDPPERDVRRVFGNLGENQQRIDWERDSHYKELEVSEDKRKGLLKAVLVLVQDDERRALVRSVFHDE